MTTQKQSAREQVEKGKQWKVETYRTPLGETGDYMNTISITNGKINLYSENEEADMDELQEFVDAVNASDIENCECGHTAPSEFVVHDDDGNGTCPNCQQEYLESLITKSKEAEERGLKLFYLESQLKVEEAKHRAANEIYARQHVSDGQRNTARIFLDIHDSAIDELEKQISELKNQQP